MLFDETLIDFFDTDNSFKVTTHSNNRNSKSSREVILGSVRYDKV